MPDSIASGTVVGERYRLDRELARGGMASVWEADDLVLTRHVAVKILDPSLGSNDALRSRFRHEAVAAARLSHPGIVATYDTGDDPGLAYIVMELVDGVTLRALLDERGPLPVTRAVDITMQVADALSHAHHDGLVHRDIKPGNVLVERNGRVKVTDFGIAKSSGSIDLTRDGAVMGTARYLAPEQLEGRGADARSDVYALAVVLYEMLAGRPPFSGDTEIAAAMARLSQDPTPLRTMRPDIPSGLEHAVQRALARDPNDRYGSAKAFRDAIAPYRVDDATPAEGFVPRPATHRRRRSGRAIRRGVLAGTVLILGVALLWRLSYGESSSPVATAPLRPLRVDAAHDFDPQGDGHEHPEAAALAIDGDPSTAWYTEVYQSPDFSGDKQGVGLVLTTNGRPTVRQVRIDSPDSGWSGAIYVADTDQGPLSSWGPVRARGHDLGNHASLTIAAPRPGRFVLVWITRLPPSGRMRISELHLDG
ncbi:MAG: protein kinase [Acidimicrobiia bacterium]